MTVQYFDPEDFDITEVEAELEADHDEWIAKMLA